MARHSAVGYWQSRKNWDGQSAESSTCARMTGATTLSLAEDRFDIPLYATLFSRRQNSEPVRANRLLQAHRLIQQVLTLRKLSTRSE